MDERVVYRAMFDRFKNFKGSLAIPKCECGKISEVFEKLIDKDVDVPYSHEMPGVFLSLSG